MFCFPLCRSISNKYWYFFILVVIIFYLNPNITGGIDQNIQSTTVENDFRIQGAFGQTQTTKGAGGDGNNNAWALSNLRFRASDSSSLYSSNIVQPKALQILIIIKIWKAGGWAVFDCPYRLEEFSALILITVWSVVMAGRAETSCALAVYALAVVV